MATKQDIETLQRIVGVKADGNFGPKTIDATIGFLKEAFGQEVWNDIWIGDVKVDSRTKIAIGTAIASVIGAGAALLFTGSDYRKKVVAIARGEIGPQDPDKYWAVVQPALMGNPKGISWCGGEALWVLHQAGLTDIMWEIGKGFAAKHLPTTRDPLPGDIAYFDQPFQHHAIVEKIEGGNLYTIDGNQSPGEQVLPKIRNKNSATAFYSIQPLIDKKKGVV